MSAEARSMIARVEVVRSAARPTGQRRLDGEACRIGWRLAPIACAAIWAVFLIVAAAGADVVELLSGAKVEGRIVARDDKSVSIETKIGGKLFTRTYPLERVAALTVGDRREVLSSGAAGEPGRRRSRRAQKRKWKNSLPNRAARRPIGSRQRRWTIRRRSIFIGHRRRRGCGITSDT